LADELGEFGGTQFEFEGVVVIGFAGRDEALGLCRFG